MFCCANVPDCEKSSVPAPGVTVIPFDPVGTLQTTYGAAAEPIKSLPSTPIWFATGGVPLGSMPCSK
jgi:hypothetical protein